jgi:hypothetical protein
MIGQHVHRWIEVQRHEVVLCGSAYPLPPSSSELLPPCEEDRLSSLFCRWMKGSVLTRSWSSSGVASCPVMRRSQPRTFSMEHLEMSNQYPAHIAHRGAVCLRAPERQARADDCHDISETTRFAMLCSKDALLWA